jgi:hypothetical protein
LQITVYSKLAAMSYYKDSNYIDCRIGAYANPKDDTFIPKINITMIDLDLSNFRCNDNMKSFELAKSKILKNIKNTYLSDLKNNCNSELATILWTGNGYQLRRFLYFSLIDTKRI